MLSPVGFPSCELGELPGFHGYESKDKRSHMNPKMIFEFFVRHYGPMALFLVVYTAGCSRKVPAPAEVVRPVRTMLVSVGGENSVRTFPGRVEAPKQVELAFQVPGLLVSLPVREGQSVAKDELIAQPDRRNSKRALPP